MTRRSFASHITAVDRALIATFERFEVPPYSRTREKCFGRELEPVLDPFPWEQNGAAEHHLFVNRNLERCVFTLTDATAPIAAAAVAAGWTETAPRHWELPGLAVLLLRDHGEPRAALIIDHLAAMRRWNEQHADTPHLCHGEAFLVPLRERIRNGGPF